MKQIILLTLILVVTFLPIGMEQYLLFENFGYDYTLWTPEQVEFATQFLACVDTVTNATVSPSRIRVALYCWEATK